MSDELSPSDLLTLLHKEIGAAGSAEALARRWSDAATADTRFEVISAQYLREVARGSRPFGPAILANLGIERVTIYRRRVK